MSTISEALQNCKPSPQFSASLFKELVIKTWSIQAEKCANRSSINTKAAKSLIKVAEQFDLQVGADEKDLVNRLTNLETLECLQLNKLIEPNVENIPEEIVLLEEEKTIWYFEIITRTEQQRYSQEKNWTVLRSVLDNSLLKSRYKQLATKTESAGKLFLTSHALYYLNQNKVSKTKFVDIHSVTPIKKGIRIQASTSGATPETYITGDGRFTYAMLQYARALVS